MYLARVLLHLPPVFAVSFFFRFYVGASAVVGGPMFQMFNSSLFYYVCGCSCIIFANSTMYSHFSCKTTGGAFRATSFGLMLIEKLAYGFRSGETPV
jgi:hypothetical protein